MVSCFVYLQLFVYFSQIRHLEASNTKSAQSKDVFKENLEFPRWSATFYCQLFVYFSQMSHLEASNTETAPSIDIGNEYLESNNI